MTSTHTPVAYKIIHAIAWNSYAIIVLSMISSRRISTGSGRDATFADTGRLNSWSKKMRLLRAFAGRHPVWAAWQVTYRCNFRCSFCSYWRDPMGQLPETTIEQFREGSARLARYGTLLINMAGGEPFIRDDIVQVTEQVARFHIPFITTNGYLSTPDLAADLMRAGLWGVSVSIDYADPARHDRARGMPGAFDRAVQALEHFRRARVADYQRVNLMMVLLNDNLDQVEPLLKLAAEYDAYLMVQPYCTMKTGSRRFVHGMDTSVSEYLLELRRRHANFLSNPWFLSRFDEALDGGIAGCKAGKIFFNIDSTGDVAACVELRGKPLGNLYRDDPHVLSRRLRAANKSASRCTACWYNCRGEVESLYTPRGLMMSLPTYFCDRGKPAAPQH